MKHRRHPMTRADAIAKAVDQMEPGDSIDIHNKTCTDPNICTCKRITIYRSADTTRRPIGFGRH